MDIVPQLLVNALITGSIYALASAGLSLTYGLLGILNFAHGHFMMFGAYMFYFAYALHDQSMLASSGFAIVAMSILAMLCMRVFVTPFLKFHLLLPFVTTLALSTILESVVSMWFGVNVKSLSLPTAQSSFQIGSVFITPIQIAIIISSLLMFGILGYVIHVSSLGRRIRALSEHPFAAQGVGIRQRRITYGVFIAAVLIAAFAGVMVGFETNMQPTMGGTYTIKAFAAMILGGLGNIWGTVIASYILGLVENLSIGLDFGGYSIPAGYKDAFAFVIILGVLIIRPQGLFGKAQRSI